MEVTFLDGVAEGLEAYVREYGARMKKYGLVRVFTHGAVQELVPNSWYNYVIMPNGRAFEYVSGMFYDVPECICSGVDLSPSQDDPSSVVLPETPVQIPVKTVGSSFVVLYLKERNIIITTDLFHSVTEAGFEVMNYIFKVLETYKMGRGFFPTFGAVPEKVLMVFNEKLFTLSPTGAIDLPEYFSNRVKSIKAEVRAFEQRLVTNYRTQLDALEVERMRLTQGTTPMPVVSRELVALGFSFIKMNSVEPIFGIVKDMKFTVKKCFRVGDGMPVELPKEIQTEMNAKIIIQVKREGDGQYKPHSVLAIVADDPSLSSETNLWRPLPHPHVDSGGGVCIGGYRLPPFITLDAGDTPSSIRKVFFELAKTLENVNPSSWFSNSADRIPGLKDWVVANVPGVCVR